MSKRNLNKKPPTPPPPSSPLPSLSQPKLPVPEEKKSKITEIAQHPLYITVMLLITLFGAVGGVSGVIAFLDFKNRKPDIHFNYHSISNGVTYDKMIKQKVTYLIIAGSIINDGEKNFYPLGWELYIISKGKKKNNKKSTFP